LRALVTTCSHIWCPAVAGLGSIALSFSWSFLFTYLLTHARRLGVCRRCTFAGAGPRARPLPCAFHSSELTAPPRALYHESPSGRRANDSRPWRNAFRTRLGRRMLPISVTRPDGRHRARVAAAAPGRGPSQFWNRCCANAFALVCRKPAAPHRSSKFFFFFFKVTPGKTPGLEPGLEPGRAPRSRGEYRVTS
jgi:hypothetical protein